MDKIDDLKTFLSILVKAKAIPAVIPVVIVAASIGQYVPDPFSWV